MDLQNIQLGEFKMEFYVVFEKCNLKSLKWNFMLSPKSEFSVLLTQAYFAKLAHPNQTRARLVYRYETIFVDNKKNVKKLDKG